MLQISLMGSRSRSLLVPFEILIWVWLEAPFTSTEVDRIRNNRVTIRSHASVISPGTFTKSPKGVVNANRMNAMFAMISHQTLSNKQLPPSPSPLRLLKSPSRTPNIKLTLRMQPPPKPNINLILRIPSLDNLRIRPPMELVLELIGMTLPCVIRCFVLDGSLALGHEEVEVAVLGGGELVVWGRLRDRCDCVGLWFGL